MSKRRRMLRGLWRRTPLSLKLISAILLFLALVTLGNSLYIVTSERQVLLEQVEAHGESLARAASIFAIEPLLIRDYPILDTFAENMVLDKHDVVSVRILRADGQVVAQAHASGADAQSDAFRSYGVQIKVEPADAYDIGRVEIDLSTHRSDLLVAKRLWTLGSISFLTFAILGLLMFTLIGRIVAAPVRALADQAKALGQGDLDTVISLSSRDELGVLATTLDGMRRNLAVSYSEIQSQNRELKELDRMKDDFLANITHEVKTPLNGILGLGSAIQAGAYGEIQASLGSPLESMQNSAIRLKNLIDQLLSFSKQGDQVHPEVVEDIELESYLPQLMEQFGHEMRSKGLDNECRIDPGLVVRGDRNLLDQIFINLLANAVKFTDRGHVHLSANVMDGDGVAISITDTGMGIPVDIQPKIYDRFQQGFAHETRHYEGSGIGLALVKQAVELLNGSILLKSTPGEGSCFTVILPITSDGTAETLVTERETARQTVSREEVLQSGLATIATIIPVNDPPPPEKAVAKSADSRATLLIVDDDGTNRQVVAAHLCSEYTILEARNSEQCLAVLEEQPVDLVLLDLMMPGMSGFDVMQYIKDRPEKAYPPVIVLSALQQVKLISRAFRLGAVDYITKPFIRDELLARTRTHLALAKREKDLDQQVRERTARLLQSEKMASIGQLAAGIAHEINTPAQFVNDNMHFLEDAFGDLDRLMEAHEQMMTAAEGGESLQPLLHETRALGDELDLEYLRGEAPSAIRQSLEGLARIRKIVIAMKEFSHPGIGEKTPTDLNKAIQTTIDISSNEWKYCTEVEMDLDPALPLTPVLPGEFNQVILNLIVNAAHAIVDVVGDSAEKGVIRIKTQQVEEWVEVTVSDTGGGIPEAIRSRIYDPFFTTKVVGKGSGQGLAIVWSAIVDKLSGKISMDSEEGKGTTFTILLPMEPQRAKTMQGYVAVAG